MVIRSRKLLIVAALATLGQASTAFAQVGGSNGPLSGIPSGIGANGSMTFAPGPAVEPPANATPGIGISPVGVPRATPVPRVGTSPALKH